MTQTTMSPRPATPVGLYDRNKVWTHVSFLCSISAKLCFGLSALCVVLTHDEGFNVAHLYAHCTRQITCITGCLACFSCHPLTLKHHIRANPHTPAICGALRSVSFFSCFSLPSCLFAFLTLNAMDGEGTCVCFSSFTSVLDLFM